MAVLDAIANVISSIADGDLLYIGEDLTGSYQDGQATALTLKNYVLTGPLAVIGSASAGASIRLPEDTDNGSHYVAIKAPDSLAGTYTLTLPADDGDADQYLKTDGSGGLSWATVSGASAPLTLTGGTVTDPSTPLTITQTWNDAADTFEAFVLNITNTASAAASQLLDLQVGGATALAVRRDGLLTLGAVAAPDGAGLHFRNEGGEDLLLLYGGGSGSNPKVVVGGNYGHPFFRMPSAGAIGFSSASNPTDGIGDTSFFRIAAGVMGVRGSFNTNGAALNLLEQTAPSAPGSNQVVIYAEDNGSGKTRLMALFPTGAAQQLAIEP